MGWGFGNFCNHRQSFCIKKICHKKLGVPGDQVGIFFLGVWKCFLVTFFVNSLNWIYRRAKVFLPSITVSPMLNNFENMLCYSGLALLIYKLGLHFMLVKIIFKILLIIRALLSVKFPILFSMILTLSLNPIKLAPNSSIFLYSSTESATDSATQNMRAKQMFFFCMSGLVLQVTGSCFRMSKKSFTSYISFSKFLYL